MSTKGKAKDSYSDRDSDEDVKSLAKQVDKLRKCIMIARLRLAAAKLIGALDEIVKEGGEDAPEAQKLKEDVETIEKELDEWYSSSGCNNL